MKLDKPYLKLLKKVRTKGTFQQDRTGTGTLSLAFEKVKYDISEQVPFLTTKKVWPKGVFEELCWFLRGEDNAKSLEDKGVSIWSEWGDPQTRSLGPIYGKQWRNFGGVDQVLDLIKGLKETPYSRRHIISAWNVPELPQMALPPCHVMTQWIVKGRTLHVGMYQRSCDMLLGCPWNITCYSSLCYLLCELTDMTPGTFTHFIGDAHIYRNHLDQVDLQLSREPRESPTLAINLGQVEADPRRQFFDANEKLKLILDNIQSDVFELSGYYPDPGIKAPVAI